VRAAYAERMARYRARIQFRAGRSIVKVIAAASAMARPIASTIPALVPIPNLAAVRITM